MFHRGARITKALSEHRLKAWFGSSADDEQQCVRAHEDLRTRQLRYPGTKVPRTGSFASPPYDGFAYHWRNKLSDPVCRDNCRQSATGPPCPRSRADGKRWRSKTSPAGPRSSNSTCGSTRPAIPDSECAAAGPASVWIGTVARDATESDRHSRTGKTN